MKLHAIYRGNPNKGPKTCVTADGYTLKSRKDLRNHSPDGFSWGYEGSGPAQLALSLLSHFLEDDEKALQIYQDFKREVIARFPQGIEWTLTGQQIAETKSVKSLNSKIPQAVI